MNTQQLAKMQYRVFTAFTQPYTGLSIDQLYTRCVVKQVEAGLFFRTIAELHLSGRLEKLANDTYRLKQ